MALAMRIHETALRIERLPMEPPLPHAQPELGELFDQLRDESPDAAESAGAIEDRIWEIWCGHSDRAAADAMEEAIAALSDERADDAEAILNDLCEKWPRWAEAWNKRATLYFMLDREAESVQDIQEALTLEPRHFGALCGFAQIARQNGDPHAARIALERALEIHPHLAGARAAVQNLEGPSTDSLH